MGKPRRGASRAAEVAWGTNAEDRILRRWIKAADLTDAVGRIVRSRDYDDFDFYLFDKRGMPLAYVEVKCRRIPLAQYGDAIAPIRKHEYAVELWEKHRVRLLMIVEYTDALAEVDLTQEPSGQRDVTRTDRPGENVPHGFWTGEQITVIEGAGFDGDDDLPEAA